MNLLTKFVQLVLPTFASLDCLIHACVCLNSRHSFRYIFFCLEFIDTYVFACARHLAFILHTRWTCMSRFQSLDHDESFRGDQSGAAEVWKAVAICWRALEIFFAAGEHLPVFTLCISLCKSYFCASWWCNNIHVILDSVITVHLYYFIGTYITIVFSYSDFCLYCA